MSFKVGDIVKITDDMSTYGIGDLRHHFRRGEIVEIDDIRDGCDGQFKVKKLYESETVCYLNENQLQFYPLEGDPEWYYEIGDYLEFIYQNCTWIGRIKQVDKEDDVNTYQIIFLYNKDTHSLGNLYNRTSWIKNIEIIQRLNFVRVKFDENSKLYSYLIDEEQVDLVKTNINNFTNVQVYDLRDQFTDTISVQIIDIVHKIDFDFRKVKKINNFSFLENKKDKKHNNIFNNEGDNTMKNIFGNFYFGPYTKNNIKFSAKGLAYRNAENNFVTLDAEGELTNVDAFTVDFDMKSILYVVPVAIDQVKVGDIIFHQKNPVYVRKINGNTIETIDPALGEVRIIIPEKNMFGFNFVSKLIDITNGIFNTATTENPFGNMLPFMLMSDSCSDMKDMIIPMMMMQNGSFDFGNVNMNQMLPFMLMSEGSFNKDMLIPMMIMQNGGFNFGNMTVSKSDEDKKAE